MLDTKEQRRNTMEVAKDIYFRNKENKIQFNKLCETCPYKCKQSFRTQIVSCRRTKEKKGD